MRLVATVSSLKEARLAEKADLVEIRLDLFDDVAFDISRQRGMEMADYLRRHGPFQPHRLSDDQMEYTTLPKVLKNLTGRFEEL